jgi:hypothetical protein
MAIYKGFFSLAATPYRNRTLLVRAYSVRQRRNVGTAGDDKPATIGVTHFPSPNTLSELFHHQMCKSFRSALRLLLKNPEKQDEPTHWVRRINLLENIEVACSASLNITNKLYFHCE